MSKKIWVSRDPDSHVRLCQIWEGKPELTESGSFMHPSMFCTMRNFADLQPGECRRFLVVPDDDWIPVESGRVPEDEQRVFVTCLDGDVIGYTFNARAGWWDGVIAWKPMYQPEPYKPEVQG